MRKKIIPGILGSSGGDESGMSSTLRGNRISVSIFGESHAEAIGMTMEGLPAGTEIDTEKLQRFLNRRAPGRNPWATSRQEADTPEFLCGIKNGKSCGTPLTAIIRNRNTRSRDYDSILCVPRPGHADYTAQLKYNGFQDQNGGGHFSGRITAALCIAGGILLQELERRNIRIAAYIRRIGKITDDSEFTHAPENVEFPVLDPEKEPEMQAAIIKAKENGDSVGGIIECMVSGLAGGFGEPIFDGMENRISQVCFAVPAVKGIEFGTGFKAAEMMGSEHNDAFAVPAGQRISNGQPILDTVTNHAGGILGGISNGMPIVFRVAIKPTPSISKPQQSVNIRTMQAEELRVAGRHDPCIVPRAVPVIEAAAAIAIADFVL